jgi:tetrahydromethanopterin S-methyltransferase subunit G
MKSKINAFITRIKRKLNTPKPVIDATTYFELSSRIDELEKKVTKRESNYRQAIRQEITSILIELKNK